MEERREQHSRIPLGEWPKKVEISEEEMHLAYLHRELTGEPIQSWIRRMVRERWEIKEDMKGSKIAEIA